MSGLCGFGIHGNCFLFLGAYITLGKEPHSFTCCRDAKSSCEASSNGPCPAPPKKARQHGEKVQA